MVTDALAKGLTAECRVHNCDSTGESSQLANEHVLVTV